MGPGLQISSEACKSQRTLIKASVMSKVQLAVYDLSQGMARGMSAQFLGPSYEIPAIPHTGIVVFGREYFFGGGIQNEDPHLFRQTKGLYPMEVIDLGETQVTKKAFDKWCQSMMRNGRFSPDAYDLLTRNCNNFCHEALPILGISQGTFPRWILEVPQKFLASPMGQMVRPMLENMQITAPVNGSNPWGNSAAPVSQNPWKQEKEERFPALKALTTPLLSNDSKTMQACITKITSTFPEGKQVLDMFANHVIAKDGQSSIDQNEVVHTMLQILEHKHHLTFALMLTRIVVLYCRPGTKIISWIRDNLNDLSGNARSMAWLVIGNIVAREKAVEQWVLENAITDMTAGQVALRQAVSAVLYNCSLILVNDNEDLDDSTVSIICVLLEEEDDGTTLERRLMAAGKWLLENNAARNLARELGLADLLEGSKSSLGKEIIALLRE